jgi:glucose-fructose oxidoreductase
MRGERVCQSFRKNSQLTALVSGHPQKLKVLGKKYGVKNLFTYEEYDECLKTVDAVYVATPNTLHTNFVIPALKQKIPVICEKPFAIKKESCEDMHRLYKKMLTPLMVAYRLHLDPANLKVIEHIQNGDIGEVKIFNSVFTMQIKDVNNIRLQKDLGGGSTWDIGIYCLNASRYIFKDEPYAVFATFSNSGDPRFKEIDEITSVILKFPGEKIASWTTSFGAHDAGSYDVIGSEGSIRLENAYEYEEEMKLILKTEKKTKIKTFSKHDQFAAELSYFSNCLLKQQEPEASGLEGYSDVRVIEAIYQSAHSNSWVFLKNKSVQPRRPQLAQAISLPPVKKAPQEVQSKGPRKSQ